MKCGSRRRDNPAVTKPHIVSDDLSRRELEELRQRHQAILQVLGDRALKDIGVLTDTIGYTLQAARQGHPLAQQALRALAQQLKEIEAMDSGLVVPGISIPPIARS